MKNRTRFISFLMGAVVALILVSLTLPVLADGDILNITGSPINVLVNGEVFKPKDANGNDLLVFVHDGTTYAPLRALAEAYGLEVGYDSATNTAAVTDPDKAALPGVSDFSHQWTVTGNPGSDSEKTFNAVYSGPLDKEEFMAWWKSMDISDIRAEAEKMAAEAQELVPGYTVMMYFSYGDLPLGSANTVYGYPGSNFDLAAAWIR